MNAAERARCRALKGSGYLIREIAAELDLPRLDVAVAVVPLTRYDVGYARGWHDVHESTRKRRKRQRERWPEYASGYQHGRYDGAAHPHCPEWDPQHRLGRIRDMPEGCPWNRQTAAASPDWEPLGDVPVKDTDGNVTGWKLREPTAGRLRKVAAALPAPKPRGQIGTESAADLESDGTTPVASEVPS